MSIHARRRGQLHAAARVSVALSTAALTIAFAAEAAVANDPSPTPSPSPSVSEPATEPTTPTAPKTDESTPAVAGKPAKPISKPRGAEQTGTVTGFVWQDTNKNGIQDEGERGVEGLSVFLAAYGPSDDGSLAKKRAAVKKGAAFKKGAVRQKKAGGYETFSLSTDENGRYEFTDVPAGSIELILDSLSMTDAGTKFWRLSPKDQGGDDAKDSDFLEWEVGSNPKPYYNFGSDLVTLEAGEKSALDAGMSLDPLHQNGRGNVTVNGSVWHDQNRDGGMDALEPGVVGLPVLAFQIKEDETPSQALKRATKKLRSVQGNKKLAPGDYEEEGVYVGTTGRAGWYEFKGLLPGSVGVAVIPGTKVSDRTGEPIAEWVFTKKDAPGTNDAMNSDVSTLPGSVVGFSDEITTKSGDTVRVNAGVFKPTATPKPAPGELPVTGAALGGLLGAGVLLLGGGAALTVVARRRRKSIA